ncbi:MAG: YdeI family protein [Gemmatimonadales bacterium]|jgi:uncharacterized protein YdeI (YjbR/CyaY-like superfamily)
MATTDKRVDAYIAKAPEYARPILTHIRAVVHESCPECEETLKWRAPTFMHHGIICMMAAFKAHVTFGFWKGSLITDGKGKPIDLGMGKDLGKLTSVSELPSKRALTGYVKQAMKLNEEGVKLHGRPGRQKPPLTVPGDLAAALRKNKKAKATFDGFSPSAKREYVEWLAAAKAEDTRARRLAQAVQWMSEGKQRNWKYM